MTTSARQNNLLLNQDWKRIYQTFKNADFKSYDFENLRRVMIGYLRENYPEDFNDYIESSEYIALIDLLAFLGQSLAFRIDLASRENFIELAERKESVLRLARTLAYNAKRNIPASGLLKFDTVSTTENILDSGGRNLARQVISWNDPSNSNWAEQFTTILNSAMTANVEFGRSEGRAVINGITTDQYRLNTASAEVPLYSFSKTVAGKSMTFEIVSTSFVGQESIYEETPTPGNQLGFIYKNDSLGPGSNNTGFFLHFRQGSLELADFTIDLPTTNEVVSVDAPNINNSDLWLYSLNSLGTQTEEWTKVSSVTGNNIAYNSISNNVRNIYSAITKDEDRVDLVFADGVYGNLPRGAFRVYYRVSNGLSYTIAPSEMTGINLSIPYVNSAGDSHTLNIGLSLKYSVNNSSPSESIDTIRNNAPAIYYTQNRMITAEDYNLAPLSSSQNILKVKSINRTSSGISRNFDLLDATGKYSSVNLFADDGYIYKEESESVLNFTPVDRLDSINFIRESIEPLFNKNSLYNFYLTKYPKLNFSENTTEWVNVSDTVNQSTGYFINNVDTSILKVGAFTSNTLKNLKVGSLIKFIPPAGKSFKLGKLVNTDLTDPQQITRIWAKVTGVVGDGTNSGLGVLNSGEGPITLNQVVPENSIASRIIPSFTNDLSSDIELEIVNLINSEVNFGLRFDQNDQTWKIVSTDNLNLFDDFALGKAGDITNQNLDASWIIAFVKNADEYRVRIRQLNYVFGSLNQNKFFVDTDGITYDAQTGNVLRDKIDVLSINTDNTLITELKETLSFDVDSAIQETDGYNRTNEINIAFTDSDYDDAIDDPDAFVRIAGEDSQNNFIFFIKNTNGTYTSFDYVDNSNNLIDIVQRESQITLSNYNDEDLIYFYASDEDVVKQVDLTNNRLIIKPEYKAVIGRAGLKFQYTHIANVDRRIDPSSSNIVDVYLLPKNYDTQFRNYLRGAIVTQPEIPTSDDLRIAYGSTLDSIKSISDEIIYHPVKYKVLFGSKAETAFQAQFKVVKNSDRTINDNNLKVQIVNAINEFFDVDNWDFGDKFYLGELVTYITNSVAPNISNIVIIPRQPTQSFGSLFEVQSAEDEILISGATVDDIVIVDAITTDEIARTNSLITLGNNN